MTTDTREILVTINSIKTLIEEFPMIKGQGSAKYSSGIDFIMDVLRNIGITDKDILNFILVDILGVNLNVNCDLGELTKKIGNISECDLNCEFVNVLDDILKFLLMTYVNSLITCDIIPRIPETGCTEGFNLPLITLDPMDMFNTCPITNEGKTIYGGISGNTTLYEIPNSTDLNAKMWYGLNIEPLEFKKRNENNTICKISGGTTLQTLNVTIDKSNYYDNEKNKYKRMYKFNKDYLDNIRILNSKTVLSYLIQAVLTGKPNISLNFDSLISKNTISNLIDGVIESETNDYTINDCYYDFSNFNFDEMMDEYELYKFGGVRTSSGSIVQTDKESLFKMLDELSENGANKIDNVAKIESILTNIPFTATTGSNVDSYSISLKNLIGWDFVKNILNNLIQAIVWSIFTPKVMALILINGQVSGIINLKDKSFDLNDIKTLLQVLIRKFFAYLRHMIKIIYDKICEKLIQWFTKEIKPLIAAFLAKIVYEEMALYIEILNEAIACISMFGVEGGSIDEVRYADIYVTENVKNNPTDIMCTT